MNSFSVLPKMWEPLFPNFLPIFLAVSFGIVLGGTLLISIWAGLILAIVFNALLVALFHPILLCYLVIAGITFTSGMGRGQIIPGLIPNEAILLFSIGLALPLILAKRCRYVRPSSKLILGTLVLIGGTMIFPIITYFFRGISLSFSEMIRLLSPTQYIPLAMLFIYIPENDEQRYNLVRWMWLCSGIVALVGLVQAADVQSIITFLHKWYSSDQAQASENVQRVTSLMGVWNGLGTFLMTNILLLRAFRHLLKSSADRLIAAVVFFLCIACLLASGSYAGLIGLALGFICISYLDKHGGQDIKYFLIGLAASILPLRSLILYRFQYQFGNGELVPSTFEFRTYVWRDIFWPVVQKNWLWGYRPKLTDLAWQYPESTYFALILSSGIFALLAHFAWLFVTLEWLWKRVHVTDEMVKTLAIFLFTLLIVLSIMGITNEVFTFSGTVDYLWILLGLIAGKEGLIHASK